MTMIRQIWLGMLPLAGVILLCAGCARGDTAAKAEAATMLRADADGELYRQAMQMRAQAAQPEAGETTDYRIRPNDVVEISVFNMPEMGVKVRVSGAGTIRMANIGEIKAEGLTDRELEKLIQDKLQGRFLQDPHVNVFIEEPQRPQVAVVGEVSVRGLHPLFGGERLLDVISRAGGLNERAGNEAYILRGSADRAEGEQDQLTIDLTELMMRGKQELNIAVHAGDCITIPEAGWVHVTGGGVREPGTYQLRSDANTIVQMLDEAGGLKYAARNKITLVHREAAGGEKTEFLNYKDIRKATDGAPVVKRGDTIIVDTTFGKSILAGIGNGLATVVRVSIGGFVNIFGA